MLMFYYNQDPSGYYKINLVDADFVPIKKYGPVSVNKNRRNDDQLIGGFIITN